MSKKLTTERFIKRARIVHGDKYSYDRTNYIIAIFAVVITCPIHGDFLQMPFYHLDGCGCPKCGEEKQYFKNVTTIEEFIIKAIKVHGNKYDYSKVVYVNANTEVIIICPIHGEFLQKPSNHTNQKQGCPRCAGVKKLTTEEFIKRAIQIHGNKYDYSKVVYINGWTKVIIICSIHGEFLQKPNGHLKGNGCLLCSGKKKPTIEEFIIKARKVHGNKYDYGKMVYINNKTEAIIICPIHGEFLQRPCDHINQKQGCPKCANIANGLKRRNTTEIFIKMAKEVHGDRYDYSKVIYIDCETEVEIICKIHGKFLQKPRNHLYKKVGCPKCEGLKQTNIKKKFIIKSIKIYNNKYDYSKMKYINTISNVQIVCPIHGSFWQSPHDHINGNGCPKCDLQMKRKRATENFIIKAQTIHENKYNYIKSVYVKAISPLTVICSEHGEFLQSPANHLAGCGCPKCKTSNGELLISKILNEKKIQYIQQKTFPGCKNIRKLKYDFYLPKQNILIEYNGAQHYNCIKYWHYGKRSLASQQHRDRIKKDYALSNGYKFLIIKYDENIEEKLNNICC